MWSTRRRNCSTATSPSPTRGMSRAAPSRSSGCWPRTASASATRAAIRADRRLGQQRQLWRHRHRQLHGRRRIDLHGQPQWRCHGGGGRGADREFDLRQCQRRADGEPDADAERVGCRRGRPQGGGANVVHRPERRRQSARRPRPPSASPSRNSSISTATAISISSSARPMAGSGLSQRRDGAFTALTGTHNPFGAITTAGLVTSFAFANFAGDSRISTWSSATRTAAPCLSQRQRRLHARGRGGQSVQRRRVSGCGRSSLRRRRQRPRSGPRRRHPGRRHLPAAQQRRHLRRSGPAADPPRCSNSSARRPASTSTAIPISTSSSATTTVRTFRNDGGVYTRVGYPVPRPGRRSPRPFLRRPGRRRRPRRRLRRRLGALRFLENAGQAIIVNVTPVNEAPVAVDDILDAFEDRATTFTAAADRRQRQRRRWRIANDP